MLAAVPEVDDIEIRLLRPDDAPRVVEAIRAVYGDSYDVPWLYDEEEIAHRIAHGQMVSGAAFGSGVASFGASQEKASSRSGKRCRMRQRMSVNGPCMASRTGSGTGNLVALG